MSALFIPLLVNYIKLLWLVIKVEIGTIFYYEFKIIQLSGFFIIKFFQSHIDSVLVYPDLRIFSYILY
jgi:hypothetical protein